MRLNYPNKNLGRHKCLSIILREREREREKEKELQREMGINYHSGRRRKQ